MTRTSAHEQHNMREGGGGKAHVARAYPGRRDTNIMLPGCVMPLIDKEWQQGIAQSHEKGVDHVPFAGAHDKSSHTHCMLSMT